MVWKLFSLEEYPGNLWQDWDRLNAEYCESHPMLDSRFVRPLTKHFPAKLDVLAGYQNKTCIALVLLERSKGFVQHPYLPSQAQLALVLLPNDITNFQPFGKSGLRFPLCRIDLIGIDSQYQSGLTTLKNSEMEVRAVDMAVDTAGDFDEYWLTRPKNLKKNISRYVNRASKELGGYELKVIKDKETIGLAVARYGFVESRGWKGKAGTALHPGNSQGSFYREVLEQFASSSQAFIFELWANDMLMASRLCISNGTLLIILKTTYEEDYRKYAFGRLLLFETLKYIFSNTGANTVDFYTNATKEQLDWSTNSRPIFNISFYEQYFGKYLRRAIAAKQTFRSKLQVSTVQSGK